VVERKPGEADVGTEDGDAPPDLLERVAEAVADLFDDEDADGS